MADRRTRIILDLDNNRYIKGLASSAAATKAFVKDLDSADSRMSNLVQTSLALGPALVPIGAAVVPAVAGLAAQLGAAAGAAGVAALAFNGVGEGLKALNDYQLEPSAKNLEKVKQAFEDLGPAGADFVVFLDKLEPKLDKLQNTARAGLFPGVEAGIRSLMERAPQVNRIIASISGALGDLAEEGGDALASDRWSEFFDYMERTARPTLMDMGRALGNVTEGLANMLVAFDPLSQDFSDGLLNMSRDFAKWSRQLQDSAGFQEFVDYVQRVSPEALDTLGALAMALVDIVEAAAPVGEVSLPIIKAIAQTLGAIADSPAGPVLVAAAAGLSALSRGAALWNAANGGAIATAFKKSNEQGGKLAKTGERLSGIFSRNGALVGGVGVFALSMSDLDDKMGITNTAMGVMLGSMAGPWGAALGGAIGLSKDWAAANDDLEDSLRAVDQAASNPSGIKNFFDTIREARKEVEKQRKQMIESLDSDDGVFGGLKDDPTGLKDIFDGDTSWLDDAWTKITGGADKAGKSLDNLERQGRQAIAELRSYTMGGGFKNFTSDTDKLRRFANRAAPALEHMGISVNDLRKALKRGDGAELRRIGASIRHFNRQADSAPGRSKAMGNALRDLNDPLSTTEDSASALASALDSVFTPALNADQAMQARIESLRSLRGQLRKTNGEFGWQTKATIASRQAIRDHVNAIATEAKAMADRGDGTKKISRYLREQRKALLQAFPKEARDEAKTLIDRTFRYGEIIRGLPKTAKTNVDAPGAKKANKEMETLDGWVRTIPDKLNIFTDAPGAKPTQKDLEGIKNRQDKVDRQLDVNTAAPGADKAKRDIDGVRGAIGKMRDKGVDVTLSSKSRGIIKDITGLFDNLNPFNADGRIWDFNANGDIKNGHVAQIAPAGAWRVWAEEETGGEAYIPFAQSKRPRSRQIATETVRRLGGDVQWNANGNITLDTRANIHGNPRRDVRDIDRQFASIAREFGKVLTDGVNKGVQNLNVGFHWPLPRRFGYSGSWGSYASGGSHPALDFPAPLGTPIYSVLPGRVTDVTHMNSSYGNHVEVAHGNGLSSLSAHMQKTLVSVGDKVASGETIGLVDSTGNSTGNHLHLEMRRGGNSFDYTNMLNSGGVGIGPLGVYDGDHSGLNQASPGEAKAYARSIMKRWGWGPFQWPYWEDLGNRESGWRWNARNQSSGAYGIPQSLPPEKMASAGGDWRTNAGTQIDWMAGYIRERYDGPYGAIQWHNAHNWYGDGGLAEKGIRVFDQGGPWPTGTLGVNLSGQTEYVNNPQTTAAAVQMANGGILDGFNSGTSGRSGRRGRIGRIDAENVVTIRTVPGSIKSFTDLLEQVGKPDAVHNIRDLNKAWRSMRQESRALDREERQLRRIRQGSKSSAKAVKESERDLSQARNEFEKSGRKAERIEERLKRARQEAGTTSNGVERAEKALAKVRKQARKDDKVSAGERRKIAEAEKVLTDARRESGTEGRKVRKLERELNRARKATIRDDKQIHRIRHRLQNQRKRAKITAKDLTRQEKAVEKQRNKLNKATEKWKNLQAELIEQAKAVSESIVSQGAVFGGQGTSNTAQGLLSKLQGAGNKANQFRRLYQNAVRRGVDRDILDQIIEQGSTPEAVNLLLSLANAPDRLIKRINRQENRLQNIADRVGTWTTTRQGQGQLNANAKSRAVVQNFNGPIYTQDPKAAAREIENRWRKGLLMAKGA